jgi:hypothetical protein
MRPNTFRLLATFVLVSLFADTAAVAALPSHWNTIGPYGSLHLQSGSTDESIVEIYLDGVGEGFLTANTALSKSGQARLFCAPDIEFNGKNYRSLLDEELQDMVQRDKARKPGSRPFSSLSYVPISIPLLQALQNKFPCEKK